jgi:hypothetical protein
MLETRGSSVTDTLHDSSHAESLSLQELERLREQIHVSIGRARTELEWIETLILAAHLREHQPMAHEPMHRDQDLAS